MAICGRRRVRRVRRGRLNLVSLSVREYDCGVSTLAEIEAAIAKLPPLEFRALERLKEREADAWDRQIEADAKSGRLDAHAHG